MKIHTGDTVVVITGKDKGKTGTIIRVLPAEGRVVIGGLNLRTRHIKKTFQEAGRIVKFEASMNVSNVMLIDPKTKKRSRVGYKVDEKGNKKRISKRSGEVVVPVRAEKTKKKAADSKKVEGSEVVAKGSSSFWKKKGPDAGEVKEGSHMQQDKSIPDSAQQSVHRSGGRGS